MLSLPSGTLTFLFTDVEGSTRLWEREPERMRHALSRHDAVLLRAMEERGGIVFKKMGDSVCAVFQDAAQAVSAAIDAQSELIESPADSDLIPLPVRMALYTGHAHPTDGDYLGATLNRTARVLSAGHGGQILISRTTGDLARAGLPRDTYLLDLGPHRLKDLESPEHLLQVCHPSVPSEFPALRSLSTFKHNLPIQLTSLIGRENEILEIKGLLQNHVLVTLYGSGGSGKTRLALQVGAELVDEFPDGVWFVELSNAADALQGEQALVTALGLREQAGRDTGQVIMEHLREQRTLLILDNCEHLVDQAANQAQELLRYCPDLKVLTTSRTVLGVRGEVTYRVPSLPLPAENKKAPVHDAAALLKVDSVRLFVERATEASPGFELTDRNAPSVALISRRLDGIPLALELAAARVRSMTVEQISERLRAHFRLLVGPRTAPSRQATLRATMDWSCRLLEVAERALLSRLTVFAGSWELEAAEAVCVSGLRERAVPEPFESEDIADLLARLEDKSLISVDRAPESARYSMLQMVREYAVEMLGDAESEALGRRHLDYYLGIAEEAEANLSGPAQGDWLRRLDIEQDNMRTALDFAKQNSEFSESGLRLAGSLARYWHIRGYLSEGLRELTAAMSLAGEIQTTYGWGMALNGAGIIHWAKGDLSSAHRMLIQAFETWHELNEGHRSAAALSNLGLVETDRGDLDQARNLLDRSLRIRREIGDNAGIGTCLNNLGNLAYRRGDLVSAKQFFVECLRIRESRRDLHGVAQTLNNLGELARRDGATDEAESYLKRSGEIFRSIGDISGDLSVMVNLARLSLSRGDREAARGYCEQALTHSGLDIPAICRAGLFCSLGEIEKKEGKYLEARSHFVRSLEACSDQTTFVFGWEDLVSLAEIAFANRQFQLSARFLGAADRLKAELDPCMLEDQGAGHEIGRRLANTIGEDEFGGCHQEYFSMSPAESVEHVLRALRSEVNRASEEKTIGGNP